jgi:TM2 domain-containing membrane protein YozV
MIAWWSLAYPGFGHLSLGSMAKGIFVFLGELVINYKAHINLAIIYSFTGEFQKSKEVLDTQWLLIYCGILVYAVWDSYRLAVEFNKLSVLGDRENAQIAPTSLGNAAINALEKRNPWLSVIWSLLVPGLGQLYNAETFKALFLLLIGASITIASHALQAIGLSAIGEFQQATAIIDPKWFLNIPSFYVYTVWDAYCGSVELNKLFDQEQAQYFRNNFQSTNFPKPEFSKGG